MYSRVAGVGIGDKGEKAVETSAWNQPANFLDLKDPLTLLHEVHHSTTVINTVHFFHLLGEEKIERKTRMSRPLLMSCKKAPIICP